MWRDGQRQEIASQDVVLDDVIELSPGDQIAVDGEMLRSDGLSADESLLTGESDAVEKHEGDEVMSGSFVDRGRRPHPGHRGGRRLLRRPTHRRGQEVQGPEVRAGPGHRPDPAGRHLGHHPHRASSSSSASGPARTSRSATPSSAPPPGWWPWCRRASSCCSAWPRPSPSSGSGTSRCWSSSSRRWRRWLGSRCWPPTRRAPSPPARSASRRSSRLAGAGNGADLEACAGRRWPRPTSTRTPP